MSKSTIFESGSARPPPTRKVVLAHNASIRRSPTRPPAPRTTTLMHMAAEEWIGEVHVHTCVGDSDDSLPPFPRFFFASSVLLPALYRRSLAGAQTESGGSLPNMNAYTSAMLVRVRGFFSGIVGRGGARASASTILGETWHVLPSSRW